MLGIVQIPLTLFGESHTVDVSVDVDVVPASTGSRPTVVYITESHWKRLKAEILAVCLFLVFFSLAAFCYCHCLGSDRSSTEYPTQSRPNENSGIYYFMQLFILAKNHARVD